jgi:hypothetical protein
MMIDHVIPRLRDSGRTDRSLHRPLSRSRITADLALVIL